MRDHRWAFAMALLWLTTAVEASPVTASPVVSSAASHAALIDGENEADGFAVTDSGRGQRSVLPSGWRRTTRGWERAEVWGVPSTAGELSAGELSAGELSAGEFTGVIAERPQTINQWIQWDRARERGWASAFFGRVRPLNPIVFAVWLVVVAVLIVKLSSAYRPEQRDKSVGT